ncbi:hypothetical protein MSAN_01195600 [Mycena sanguinolenta]|uniref:Uncharacterized protein n=1 Tax=Mycena sanguinolenta TaxID=230812 RepID=A0A8H7D4L2_9AGAR|nr:hypothetical protein MSAN_01195600 [Mycena sanguinolenta]
MDDRSHAVEEESDCLSQTASASVQSLYTGAFFPSSHHLVVAGGTFTSHNTSASSPSDYLRIPLGSIDLRTEIRPASASGVVSRNSGPGAVRRTYTARVDHRTTPMTVALYQGDDAEEEWRVCVSLHSRFRHPQILQIFATASWSGVYAAVFYGDLIPFEQFLGSFRHSAILQAYIYAYTSVDQYEALDYCGQTPELCCITPWVRRSTGRLCIESATGELDPIIFSRDAVDELTPPDSIQALHDANQEARVIASLAVKEWYSLVHEYLTQYRSPYISVQAEVKVGSIIRWPSGCEFENATEIAWDVPDPGRGLMLTSWYHERLGMWQEVPVRYNSGDVFGSIIIVWPRDSENDHAASWLSQANYIFTRLNIPLHYDAYVQEQNSAPDRDGESEGSSSYDEFVQDYSSDQTLVAQDSALNRGDENAHRSSCDEFVQHGMRFHAPLLDCDLNDEIDPSEPTQDCGNDAVAWQCTFGQLLRLLKFGLIFALGVMHLYERARLIS